MNRKKLTIVSAVVLVLALTAIIKAQEPAAQKKDQTLKVDVDLVLVNATVTDPQNRYVTGLEPDHFQLWELLGGRCSDQPRHHLRYQRQHEGQDLYLTRCRRYIPENRKSRR
jgi:hypothetical protein